MARPVKYTAAQAKAIYAAMSLAKGYTPTVAEFAKRLRVSTRTAWRYMGNQRARVKCICCKGTGYVSSR